MPKGWERGREGLAFINIFVSFFSFPWCFQLQFKNLDSYR